MKKFSIVCVSMLAVIFFFSGCVLEQQAAIKEDVKGEMNKPKLPFDVSVGGIPVQLTDSGKAVIKTPVAPDAEIVCNVLNKGIISISFFPCNSDGVAVPGKKPEIIIIRDGNKTLLSNTIDKKQLESGFYLMNVTADKKTIEVIIQIVKS